MIKLIRSKTGIIGMATLAVALGAGVSAQAPPG